MLNSGQKGIVKWSILNVECSEVNSAGNYSNANPINSRDYYPSASVMVAFGERKSGTNNIANACVDHTNGMVYATAPAEGTYPVMLLAFYFQDNS